MTDTPDPVTAAYPEFDQNQAVFDGLVRYVVERDGIPEDEAITNLTNLLGSPEVTARHAEKVANSPAVKLVQAQGLLRELATLLDPPAT